MIYMPKGAKVLKDLLSHKEKLEKEASLVKLSEECSTIIQRSLPPKEGDPGSFTLPCHIRPLAIKNPLADLGAILEINKDELVLIILGRPFLATTRATEAKDEGDSNEVQVDSFYPRTEPVEPLEWKASQNQLKSSSVKPPKLELKELPEHLEGNRLEYCEHKRVDSSFCTHTILMEDEFKPSVQPQRRVNPNIKEAVKKEVIKLLDAKLIIPSLTVLGCACLRCPKERGDDRTIFHELVEDSMEVFMDDFSVFGSSFDHYLKNLEKMLKRCEETNLVLNWEKCHFMVKEGIVIGHKALGWVDGNGSNLGGGFRKLGGGRETRGGGDRLEGPGGGEGVLSFGCSSLEDVRLT
nr:hypothetical protein [Tanacetum cinerariifolium]